METLRALEIARCEWDNIRVSLERCGDIGEFSSGNNAGGRILSLHDNTCLIKNLIEMERKLPSSYYFSEEAAHVFAVLASRAGERLGLNPGLAQTFGNSYSWVRTGCLGQNRMQRHHLIKQLFFFKLFFPLGSYFGWYFDTQSVKSKLGLVFYKFITWQNSPNIYIQDVREFREQLEPLWNGLSIEMGFQREFPQPQVISQELGKLIWRKVR